ncbi:ABC transporter permease [Arhodomonas sp. AD133]|uniref:ABC transporter permease n=1 Tax=Arhodomonas sp. AD133 TaxID=3415009 RepID=UPI003EBEF2A1
MIEIGGFNVVTWLAATLVMGTPLVLAGLGEFLAEKTGVLNLGTEGMMLVGAVTGFIAFVESDSQVLGFVASMVAGAVMAALFAVLTQTFRANQVASGLALTIFGVGLSAFMGRPYEGEGIKGLAKLDIPVLSDLPIVGPIVFSQDPMVYVSLALGVAIIVFTYHTRAGLVMRAVGESPESAHAMGYPVIALRYLAVCVGGSLAGLGGAYMSLVEPHLWVENLVAGRGWIAVALVVFASWRPGRVLVGAYLFGGITRLGFELQGLGVPIPSQALSSLPYLATIVVLVLLSRDQTKLRLNRPASLTKPFFATG